jgi:trans-aconitate methyltransferase
LGREASTLLELGSGGGNNASHMNRRFAELVLVDVAPGMLEVSRRLNPECAHVAGDMRTVRLGRASTASSCTTP